MFVALFFFPKCNLLCQLYQSFLCVIKNLSDFVEKIEIKSFRLRNILGITIKKNQWPDNKSQANFENWANLTTLPEHLYLKDKREEKKLIKRQSLHNMFSTDKQNTKLKLNYCCSGGKQICHRNMKHQFVFFFVFLVIKIFYAFSYTQRKFSSFYLLIIRFM